MGTLHLISKRNKATVREEEEKILKNYLFYLKGKKGK
jgi:hypothetical protein